MPSRRVCCYGHDSDSDCSHHSEPAPPVVVHADAAMLEHLSARLLAVEQMLLTVTAQKATLLQRVHSLEHFVQQLDMPVSMRATFESLLSSPSSTHPSGSSFPGQ